MARLHRRSRARPPARVAVQVGWLALGIAVAAALVLTSGPLVGSGRRAPRPRAGGPPAGRSPRAQGGVHVVAASLPPPDAPREGRAAHARHRRRAAGVPGAGSRSAPRAPVRAAAGTTLPAAAPGVPRRATGGATGDPTGAVPGAPPGVPTGAAPGAPTAVRRATRAHAPPPAPVTSPTAAPGREAPPARPRAAQVPSGVASVRPAPIGLTGVASVVIQGS